MPLAVDFVYLSALPMVTNYVPDIGVCPGDEDWDGGPEPEGPPLVLRPKGSLNDPKLSLSTTRHNP